MTLLEIMIGLALLVAISLGFLYTAMGTVRINRMTEQEVSGTNAISGQLDAVMTAALDNSSLAHGTAKGLILYLQRLHGIVGNSAGYPIRVALDSAAGILYYEFPIAVPGSAPSPATTDNTSTLVERQNPLARGVMMLYLRENSVPDAFYTFDNLYLSPSGEESTAGDNNFFDMDGDGSGGGNFTSLFTDSVDLYPSNPLASLPATIMVRYYSSIDRLNADRHPTLPAFLPDQDRAALSLVRHIIINNDSVIGLGIY